MIDLARNLLAVLRHAIRPTVGTCDAPPAALHFYRSRNAGKTGGTEPTWPTGDKP